MSLEPVSISERAAEEIKVIRQSDEIPNDHWLRIGVNEGGCGSGGEMHGVQIYIDKKHVMYLMGQFVEYKEDGDEWGFVFEELEDKS
jgi:iron-sulfur cluster assembly protein